MIIQPLLEHFYPTMFILKADVLRVHILAKCRNAILETRKELQIFTDNHGNTRAAEIFDGKNKAYSVMTRTVFKDVRQREMARPDKDDTRQRSLQLMPEKKNSKNIIHIS